MMLHQLPEKEPNLEGRFKVTAGVSVEGERLTRRLPGVAKFSTWPRLASKQKKIVKFWNGTNVKEGFSCLTWNLTVELLFVRQCDGLDQGKMAKAEL